MIDKEPITIIHTLSRRDFLAAIRRATECKEWCEEVYLSARDKRDGSQENKDLRLSRFIGATNEVNALMSLYSVYFK